jgi:hypothetical protein
VANAALYWRGQARGFVPLAPCSEGGWIVQVHCIQHGCRTSSKGGESPPSPTGSQRKQAHGLCYRPQLHAGAWNQRLHHGGADSLALINRWSQLMLVRCKSANMITPCCRQFGSENVGAHNGETCSSADSGAGGVAGISYKGDLASIPGRAFAGAGRRRPAAVGRGRLERTAACRGVFAGVWCRRVGSEPAVLQPGLFYLGLGLGGMEHLAFDPLTVWTTVLGVVLLGRRLAASRG